MTFRSAANIDPNAHKGLVISNSISNNPLIATGLSLTNAQPLHVAIVDGSGTQVTSFGGGTQYAELATTSPGTGTLSLGRYKLAAPTLTDGQLYGLQLDSSGNLKVTGSLSVGGTTDNTAFTAGTSTGTPAMGFYHSTIDSVTDGRSAAVGITSKRALLVNLQTAAGVETGVAAAPLQVSLANTAANVSKLLVTADAITFASPQHVILDSGSLTANQSVNVAQINGVTPLMGNGGTGTGSQRVTIASDNTAFSVNATLSAETTKVIGTVNVAASQTIAVTNTGTFAVQNTPVAPTTIFNGKTSTVTAGSRVVLAASQAVQSVTIKALITNTGLIYVGSSSVSSANGFQLSAGETVSMDVANLNTVNIDSSVNGEGVTYIGIN